MTFCAQINQILNTVTLKTILSLKTPVMSFLNYLSSYVLLSHKPLSCKTSHTTKFNLFLRTHYSFDCDKTAYEIGQQTLYHVVAPGKFCHLCSTGLAPG